MIIDLAVIEQDGIEKSKAIIEKAMAILPEKFAIVHDAETEEGYERNKADAKTLQQIRFALDKRFKEEKAPLWKRCKDLDGLKKIWTGTIPALEDKFKSANQEVDDRKAHEEAEAAQKELARVESILEKIKAIEGLPVSLMDKSSVEIQAALGNLDSACEWAEEYQVKASTATEATADRLSGMVEFKQQQEEFAAEKAKQEAVAAEEKAKSEAEERMRQEEAERKNREEAEKLAKERAAIEAEKKAIADAKAAAEREAARVEAERRATEETNRKMGIIRDDIATSLSVAGIARETAEMVAEIIVDGSIPHIQITYQETAKAA